MKTGCFWRSWRAVPFWAALGAILLVGYAIVVPPIWRARAVLLTPYQEEGLKLQVPVFTEQSDPLAILRGIMTSRASLDRISEQTGVPVRELEDAFEVQVSPEENQLRISAVNPDGEKATDIVRHSIRTLAVLARANTVSVSGQQAKYLKDALARRTFELEEAEKAMADFQRSAKTIVDPTNPLGNGEYIKRYKENQLALNRVVKQIEAAKQTATRIGAQAKDVPTGIPEIEAWRQKVATAEYDLRIALGQFGDRSPNVVRAKQALETAQEALRKEVSRYLQSVDQGIGTQMADLEAQRLVLQWENQTLKVFSDAAPSEALEYARMLRNVATLTASAANLQQQYELAASKAEIEKVRWSLLVEPYVEEKPVNKGLARHGIVGLLLGLALGCLLAYSPRPQGTKAPEA